MDGFLVTEVLLPRLLGASVQAALLVGLVWLLCRLLPRLSAATRATLWWLVALQLVVGVLWPSPLSLPILPNGVMEVVAAAPASAVPTLQGSGVMLLPASAAPGSAPGVSESTWSWMGVVGMAWLLGLAWMLARTLRSYLDTRRLLGESRHCTDPALASALKLAADAHGLRAAPELRLSSSIESPQLIGPWRPVLVLPANYARSMHADELDMALTHELVHLQRQDLWWGLVPAVARHLFFFHPLAHFAVREYELTREAACDAAVIAGRGERACDYGRLLVRLGVAPRPIAGLASASTNFHVLKRRLIMLQNPATTPRAMALVMTLAVAILGVVPYRIVAAPLAQSTAPEAVRNAHPSTTGVAPPPPPAPPAAPRAGAPSPPVPASAPSTVPAPPAPPLAPPSPPAPPTPPIPPMPPMPPAPSIDPGGLTSTQVASSGGDSAYVLIRGENQLMMGSRGDLDEARLLQREQGDLLWFRKGSARYVVRDPTVLARFGKVFDEINRIGQAQGALGRRQGELGAQQGKIGAEQGRLGAEQAQLAAEQAQRAAALASGAEFASAGSATSSRKRPAELDARQRELAQEIGELGERQAQLGREQAALGKRQAAASQQAAREAAKLMEESIAKGLARPASG